MRAGQSASLWSAQFAALLSGVVGAVALLLTHLPATLAAAGAPGDSELHRGLGDAYLTGIDTAGRRRGRR